jgi:hypothetical protein
MVVNLRLGILLEMVLVLGLDLMRLVQESGGLYPMMDQDLAFTSMSLLSNAMVHLFLMIKE